jgi:hypothetical protein
MTKKAFKKKVLKNEIKDPLKTFITTHNDETEK